MLEAFHETYTMLVAFYAAARVFMGSYCFLLAFTVPMVRGMMFVQTILTFIPVALWIGSIHVDIPQRYAIIWVAIFLDLCGSVFVIMIFRSGKLISKALGAWVDRVFEFYPAVNIEHKTERTNAFVGLVFGYSVVAIIYQNSAHFGLNAFFGKAILGLIQAFCFNWIYFELDGADLYSHAIRRNVSSGEFSISQIISDIQLIFESACVVINPPSIHHGLHSLRWRSVETRCGYGYSRCGST
jgi:low temperature requirement protein LtrA